MLNTASGEGVSAAYHAQAVSALRFLFTYVLRRPYVQNDIPRPRRDRKLPNVLAP
jgi:site-specific recombinase XerC